MKGTTIMEPIVLIALILSTIRDVHPEPAPSGVIYSGLMAHGVTFDEYMAALAACERTELVANANHSLTLLPLGIEKANLLIEAGILN
jgi:hypothetical protein